MEAGVGMLREVEVAIAHKESVGVSLTLDLSYPKGI